MDLNLEKFYLDHELIPLMKSDFDVIITDKDGKMVIQPCTIHNLLIESDNISLAIFDIAQRMNLEAYLHDLSKGFLFKKKVTITINRYDSVGQLVYKTVYYGCKLNGYCDNVLISNDKRSHIWHLDLKFKKKEIIQNIDYPFSIPKMSSIDKNIIHNEPSERKEDENNISLTKTENISSSSLKSIEKTIKRRINDLENNIYNR